MKKPGRLLHFERLTPAQVSERELEEAPSKKDLWKMLAEAAANTARLISSAASPSAADDTGAAGNLTGRSRRLSKGRK